MFLPVNQCFLCIFAIIQCSEFIMASKEKGSGRQKRVNLSIAEKLELVRRAESGVSIACVCNKKRVNFFFYFPKKIPGVLMDHFSLVLVH